MKMNNASGLTEASVKSIIYRHDLILNKESTTSFLSNQISTNCKGKVIKTKEED